MTKHLQILVVEDEEAIRAGLIDVLVFPGYAVDSAATGPVGLGKALTGKYDLILLDVMLPGMDGYEICNRIRSEDSSQPINMLKEQTSDEEIIQGLKLGADDTINSGTTDAVAAILELTAGRGADVVFEAVGATPTVKMAIESARKGGVVTLIGNIASTIEFGLQSVVTREITVLGSCASSNDFT